MANREAGPRMLLTAGTRLDEYRLGDDSPAGAGSPPDARPDSHHIGDAICGRVDGSIGEKRAGQRTATQS